MSQNDTKFIDYPKVELHRHLEGSIRIETLLEISPDLDGIEKAQEYFQVKVKMPNLSSVIERFLRTQKLLGSYEVLERIAYEACEDAFNENIRLLELRYAPSFISMGRDMDFTKIHEAFLKGIATAEKEFPMAVGLIGIMVRSQSIKEAGRSMDFFIENKESFIGVDLADVEVGFDCRDFRELFYRAKKEGLNITCHSGEEAVPDAPRFVKNAIEILDVDRIGHGLQIIHDQNVQDLVKERGVVLELCPTSNLLTGNWPDIKSHPLKALFEKGILTTLNSDDPGIFGIDLSHEWEISHKEIGLSIENLIQMQDIAAKASFLPKDKIQQFWPSPTSIDI